MVTAGPFQKIYNPSIGESKSWYVNDHSFILDRNGTWHLFGITHPEPANPLDEKKFAHATSPSLSGPWKKEPFSLEADFDHWQETHLWAPYTLSENNLYYQFYCAGGSSSQSYRIHLATSSDLWSWKRHPDNPLFIDGFDARDPMVLKEKGEYILYYTATETPAGGNHIVACRKSKDLVHWGSRMTCYTDPSKGTFGGPTESPFVVRRGKSYYLFIGPRPDYVGTDVFVSNTPYHWDNSDLVGHIDSHAAEIIRDKDGSWFVSHAGWGQKGVYLAPLYWQDGLDQEDSSVQEKKKK
ncbi:glycosyl hydrolase family 32 [Patescibacteria group bacterium]|nr:glycosyl hydrolase family 32 [Patescibacteria group bacterium]MBU1622071.1 glycosyl hydrolase family 32 [Nanoarchaeota archaeon]